MEKACLVGGILRYLARRGNDRKEFQKPHANLLTKWFYLLIISLFLEIILFISILDLD